jgi:hypothetical protein
VDDSQEDEKIDGPKALDNPPVGKVSDPDLSRLLRSFAADEATEEAIEAECRKPGREGAATVEVGIAELCLCCGSRDGSG